MLVKQEQVSPCEVKLQIQIDADKVDAAVNDTYAELGKVTNIPGFRKGKAPRVILERVLDEERVKDRVADKLLKSAYIEALEESKLEPFAPADVDIEKFELGEPLVFKAVVPLEPKIELGDYKGIKVDRKVEKVTKEALESEIQGILERHAGYPEVHDREVREGDVVRVEMKKEDEPESEAKPQVILVKDALPGMKEGLLGMNPEEEKVIEVTYPEDHEPEEYAGKTCRWIVKLCEIHEKNMPELTDEWVKENFTPESDEGAESEEEKIDTVKKLRAKIKSLMEQASEQAADTEVRNNVVDKVIENAKVDFPGIMVAEGIEERMETLAEQLKKRQLSVEDYLKYRSCSLEELRAEYEEQAKKELKSSLVLGEVISKEELKIEDSDVEAELEAMANENRVPVETIKAYLDRTKGMTGVRNRILTKKVVDFLVEASNIKNVS
jgi:trigger factor